MIDTLLNRQINMELDASNFYLNLGIHFEKLGYEGFSKLFYEQANEERQHMLKLIHFTQELDIEIKINNKFKTENMHNYDVFSAVNDSLSNEKNVSNHILEIYNYATTEKLFVVSNFMEWFITEQHHEEEKFKKILDKFKIIGHDNRTGIYMIDQEMLKKENVTIDEGSQG